VSRFNVVYKQFIAMNDSGWQICCNWSRLKPGFTVPAHRNNMLQMNMIPHPVTLNWPWTKQPILGNPRAVRLLAMLSRGI